MGMFDSVMFPCPDCGRHIEAQSKSGPCTLQRHWYTQVPEDVAQDVNRHAPFTCLCGKVVQSLRIPEKPTIELEVL